MFDNHFMINDIANAQDKCHYYYKSENSEKVWNMKICVVKWRASSGGGRLQMYTLHPQQPGHLRDLRNSFKRLLIKKCCRWLKWLTNIFYWFLNNALNLYYQNVDAGMSANVLKRHLKALLEADQWMGLCPRNKNTIQDSILT